MIINNLAYQREQCVRDNAPSGGGQSSEATTGNVSFVYAVQADGKLLGETLWQKQQQEAGNDTFSFREDSIDQQRQSGISLANIERMMKDSLLQYQQQAALPIEPPPEVASSNSNYNNNNITTFHDSSNNKSLYLDGRKELSNQYMQKSHEPVKENFHPNHPNGGGGGGDGDEYDSLLADFDVDQVISQHKQSGPVEASTSNVRKRSDGQAMPYSSSSFHSTSRTAFDYGDIDEEPPTSNYGGVSSFSGDAGLGNAASSYGSSLWNSENSNNGPSSFNNFNSDNGFNYTDPMLSNNNNNQRGWRYPALSPAWYPMST